jgi:hypothetical protein
VITMYAGDHPPPHFHARYGGQSVSVGIEPLAVLIRANGSVSPADSGPVAAGR